MIKFNPFFNIENPQLMSYEYAWLDFIKYGNINSDIVPDAVAASWKRCRALKISCDHPPKTSPTPSSGASDADSNLMQFYGMVHDIIDRLDSDNFYCIITDPQGKKIAGFSKNDQVTTESTLQISLIDDFSEESCATNCFSIAAKLRKPYSVVGAQHYLEFFHDYAGYCAPIFTPDKSLLGMVGIYIPVAFMDDYILSFTVAIEYAIENNMSWHESIRSEARQKDEKQYILNTVSDGVIFLDKNRKITHGNRRLSELLGSQSERLVGEDISCLTTTPSISELLKYPFSSIGSNIDNKISLVDNWGRSVPCFFNRYKGLPEDGNEVWVFTEYSEIKKLAKKLSPSINSSRFTFHDIQSSSKSMQMVVELAKKAASFEASTVIEGESGTGKEMLAQAIHNFGPRKAGPFVAVDCGALPSNLLESELFGYEEGAFTGAKRGGKVGRFKLADKGTIFLDEITNMPYDVQSKLLRALQERMVVPVGGTHPVPFDVQVIAATNKDILAEIEQGSFRRDLFYRLNLIHIKVPPLRDRENDIQMFVNYFLSKLAPGKDVTILPEAMEILRNYDWPGNVRQLENIIERMLIISNSRSIGVDAIPSEILQSVSKDSITELFNPESVQTLNQVSSIYVKKIVEKYRGNVTSAAKALGISRVTVYRYLEDK